ncbi:MAG: hypothetical protein MK219_01785 [Candidatus Poseidoniia archaeon]|nr:hypothetical protein [Candidatus Poseidoniia archaeon]
MASDRITFRFPIDKQFRADWDDFLRRARDADSTPSQTLQQLVIEYLNQQKHEEEVDDDEETDQQAPPASEKRKPARKVRKVHRKPPEPVFEPELEEGALAQANTPKFRMLALMRSLDDGEGVDPDMLLSKAKQLGIPRPRLEMQKLVRRGILYLHEGLYRTTS